MILAMKYSYCVLICKPELLEYDMNNLGAHGWKLFHVQPINNITGVTMQGIPKQELTYQLIFQKRVYEQAVQS